MLFDRYAQSYPQALWMIFFDLRKHEERRGIREIFGRQSRRDAAPFRLTVTTNWRRAARASGAFVVPVGTNSDARRPTRAPHRDCPKMRRSM
jgi:hypothetical protein